ncbi:hypothetical protein [Salimicrobium halophilum]|uniref:Uncharacterized protein n=1 Tax=Salimicrobium halophilum TaxID=86666 RepID=A0A1G8WGI9_9BACI|nr:hypothetical protein [Salimicrobium halophilum]SDJ76775.1 hypothetical protein SAMN04490247_3161 [Salimicrobium halophilum]
MDMKRVEEIQKDLNNVLMHTKGIDHVLHRMDDVKELVQTIRQQSERIELYEGIALDHHYKLIIEEMEESE